MPLGRERFLADGEMLWRDGDTNISFYVVLEGAVAILAGPHAREVVLHERGGFTGDVDMLSGSPSAVQARANGGTRVL
ncbi:MAG TPA: cyclic nucleotide-binding domain-containing protein, partial [Blastocatellia bacterium]|nr:cyclic nucleotide-binding domain-containing protein [Blastocatellia bacterium]